MRVRAIVRSDGDSTSYQSERKRRIIGRGGLAKGVKANRPRSLHPRKHDPGGIDDTLSLGEQKDDTASNALPTTTGLAQSFLSSEPAKEKEQLKAAIAKSQHLDQSQVSDDGEEDFEEGLGAGLSLPGFVANFLKGVGDRLKATIKDVRIDLAMKLDLSSATSPGSYTSNSESLTLRFSMAKIEVHEATFDHNARGAGVDDSQTVFAGSRRIAMENIQGMLISDSSLFSFLAQFSGPPLQQSLNPAASKRVPLKDQIRPRHQNLQHHH